MRLTCVSILPILTLTILLFFFGYSFPEDSIPEGQKPGEGYINIKADRIEYDRDKNTYKTEGNVEIVQDSSLITADSVMVNLQTKEAQAIGKITLIEGEDILKSDRIEIDLDSQKGTIYNGTLFFKKENIHFTGDKIEKLGKDRYRIIDGEFTTCDGDSPPWKFRCQEVNVTLEGYATFKHSSFFIKELPVLYVPYLIFPAKTKRQTGLLIPSLGFNEDEGARVILPFYWVISDNMDATFSLDNRSKRGMGEAVEYRYLLSKNNTGNLYFYHMEELSRYRQWKEAQKGQTLISSADRWVAKYQHEKYFDPTFTTKIDISSISDRDFYRDFSEDVNDRSKEVDESNIFMTKVWERFDLSSVFTYTEDLEREDKTTLQRLPAIEFTSLPQRIFGSSIFFGFKSTYDNLWREKGQKGQRIDIHPEILYTFYTDYFELKPEIGVRETVYKVDEEDDRFPNREIYNVNLGLSSTIHRIFEVNAKRLKKVKHSIKPELYYTYIPNVDQEDLPNFDSVDRIKKTDSITYSLTSDIIGKVLESDNSSSYHKYVRLKVSQDYDFIEAKRDLEFVDDSRRPFSLISGEIDLTPTKNIFLKLDGKYDAYNSFFNTYNILMGLKDGRGDFIDFDYRNTKDELEDISTKLKLVLTDSVNLKVKNRHSIFNDLSLETVFELEYKAQCWGVRTSYSDRAIEDEDRREQSFMVMFSLKGVGDIGG
ncbi:MAG: LPS assembly protein LptD [Thermodesulfobacteriota bacterium]|nr:LPS assembly protein LptD [Thermodesulfobacteriota bacterium]